MHIFQESRIIKKRLEDCDSDLRVRSRLMVDDGCRFMIGDGGRFVVNGLVNFSRLDVGLDRLPLVIVSTFKGQGTQAYASNCQDLAHSCQSSEVASTTS